jgi:hypothetical protein
MCLPITSSGLLDSWDAVPIPRRAPGGLPTAGSGAAFLAPERLETTFDPGARRRVSTPVGLARRAPAGEAVARWPAHAGVLIGVGRLVAATGARADAPMGGACPPPAAGATLEAVWATEAVAVATAPDASGRPGAATGWTAGRVSAAGGVTFEEGKATLEAGGTMIEGGGTGGTDTRVPGNPAATHWLGAQNSTIPASIDVAYRWRRLGWHCGPESSCRDCATGGAPGPSHRHWLGSEHISHFSVARITSGRRASPALRAGCSL